jgi:hypothetical protein
MPRIVVVTIALAGIGVTAAMGGFDLVTPPLSDDVPVAVGEEFNGGPWLVTVESAEIGYNLRGHGRGERTLVLQVNARIENIDNRSRYVDGLVPILDFARVPGLVEGFTDIRSLRDNSQVADLQPGLPERVAFIREIEPGTAVPGEVTIVISSLVRRYESWEFTGSLTEDKYDDRGDVVPPGVVTVPVLDRTATT